MTRYAVVTLARELGFKKWGRFRAYGRGNDSKYQCFRRGNSYAWIGNRFVEVSFEPTALDFTVNNSVFVYAFLMHNQGASRWLANTMT